MAKAHAQKHPYHLVNPSPWPLTAAAIMLLLVTGGLLFMHEKPAGGILLALGVLGVLGVMFVWWRDVIREGLYEKAHTKAVQHGLRWGMALFITSEVMFFVAFFWAFFNAALHPTLPLQGAWPIFEGAIWPPANIETFDAWDLPLMNTLILLLSGTTVTWAHHALLEGKREDVIKALALTVGLGMTFTALQALEYSHAGFAFTDGVYPSAFFMATGFHGFHVIVGTIFLAVCLVRAKNNTLTKQGHLGFEFAAWYWHFVDVVWLFLFVSIYWWGS